MNEPAERVATLVCARCGCAASNFHALPSEGGLAEVCELCYLLGSIAALVRELDSEQQLAVLPDLREVHTLLLALLTR